MRRISHETDAGLDFYLLLGDFPDEFYKALPDVRAEMLAAAPKELKAPELVPFLAATAHKLANDYSLNVPGWVFEERCYLPGAEPHFGSSAKGKLCLLFMYKSPVEFKHRNLFADENVLLRV